MSRINIFVVVGLLVGLVSALPYNVDVTVPQINILFYTGINQYATIPLGNFSSEISNFMSSFKMGAKIVFYFSEWGVDPAQCQDTQDLGNALFSQGVNVFVVNYTSILPAVVPFEYLIDYEVAYKLNYLGGVMASISKPFFDLGPQGNALMHQIGFGLGAQLVSEISHAYGDGVLFRVTALDPIGWYRSYPLFNPLNPSRAQNIDAIHTDSNNFGLDYNVAHWDVYTDAFNLTNSVCADAVNIDGCLHFAAVKYYTYSISHNYLAKQCDSPESCALPGFNAVNMGYNLNLGSPKGTYYLKSINGSLALTSY